MNFKKIEDEAYKDIAPYIDVMLPYIETLGDLYLANIDGHHYILMREKNKFVFVDNENGFLNVYSLEFDEKGRIVKYSDELNDYELSYGKEDNARLVRSTDKLKKTIDQLVYFTPIENDPTYYIDFYQCFPDNTSSVIFNYDVTQREKTLDAALAYLHYQLPNRIVISQLVYILKIFAHKKEQIFYEDAKGNMYRHAMFKFGENLFPEFNKQYPKDKVIYAIEDMGYKVKVPNEMQDLLRGKSKDLKRLELVVSEYKKREKDKE